MLSEYICAFIFCGIVLQRMRTIWPRTLKPFSSVVRFVSLHFQCIVENHKLRQIHQHIQISWNPICGIYFEHTGGNCQFWYPCKASSIRQRNTQIRALVCGNYWLLYQAQVWFWKACHQSSQRFHDLQNEHISAVSQSVSNWKYLQFFNIM